MNQLNVNVTHSASDKVSVFKLSGHLDAGTVSQLTSSCEAEKSKSHYKWVIDMSELEYISSAGLSFFMGVVSDLRNQGGDILFVGLTPKTSKIFNVLGFNQLFEVFSKEADAVKVFAP